MSQPSTPAGFKFPPQHHGMYLFDNDVKNVELANTVSSDEEQPWKGGF